MPDDENKILLKYYSAVAQLDYIPENYISWDRQFPQCSSG
jgi:hypothetical protein